jgi:hypothetical protein
VNPSLLRISIIATFVLIVLSLYFFLSPRGSSEDSDALVTPISNDVNIDASENKGNRHEDLAVVVGDSSLETRNPAIKRVDDSIAQMLEPSINSFLFDGGVPITYLRHQALQIDSGDMKVQAEHSLARWRDGQVVEPISLPLFDDIEIDVMIQNWTDGGRGVQSASGRVVSPDFDLNPASDEGSVWLTFVDSGPMEITINAGEKGYLVKGTGGLPYYVVVELNMRGDDIQMD